METSVETTAHYHNKKPLSSFAPCQLDQYWENGGEEQSPEETMVHM